MTIRCSSHDYHMLFLSMPTSWHTWWVSLFIVTQLWSWQTDSSSSEPSIMSSCYIIITLECVVDITVSFGQVGLSIPSSSPLSVYQFSTLCTASLTHSLTQLHSLTHSQNDPSHDSDYPLCFIHSSANSCIGIYFVYTLILHLQYKLHYR